MNNTEVEVKVLLENKIELERFTQSLIKAGFGYIGQESQLNHYFSGKLSLELLEAIAPSASVSDVEKLREVLTSDKQSVRTRQITDEISKEPTVLLIVKSALQGTPENGLIRIEYEVQMSCTLDRLDNWLLEYGLKYQSKWSRDRKTYQSALIGDGLVTATIDRNAGYGYVGELEIMCSKEESTEAQNSLSSLLSELGFEELKVDRLDRMFQFYSANWREYYGTDKTFVME